MIEKLILWILLSSCASLDLSIRPVAGGRVLLNGPSIQTADLRAIDGYVASGLPLFADTHGFVLHSGKTSINSLISILTKKMDARNGGPD